MNLLFTLKTQTLYLSLSFYAVFMHISTVLTQLLSPQAHTNHTSLKQPQLLPLFLSAEAAAQPRLTE